MVNRIDQLTDFKAQMSKKMMELYSVLDELKEIFRKFAAEEQVKLASLPVFFQGVEFYCNLLKFDASEIFAQLELDMKRTKLERDQMLKLKEKNIKRLLEGFESMQTKWVLTPPLLGRSREESFKTLRDLPLFGFTEKPVDFRHPSVEDLQAMPKNKPIQAVGLKWKIKDSYICAIQVVISNGSHSPVFLGRGMNADNL